MQSARIHCTQFTAESGESQKPGAYRGERTAYKWFHDANESGDFILGIRTQEISVLKPFANSETA
jgi:hypothetical protein